MRKAFIVSVVALVMLGTAGWFLATNLSARPLSGRDFRADRIIDDALFYNGNALTVDQIQNFLNARVPVCDTHGQRMINSTQTRAQWAQANGRPLPPYICLRDFRQDHGARSDSGLCSPIPARTNQSAAQIIDTVARACNISQKVLLVKLEKEQSLVTDDWPWPIQYEKATGFACPDDPNRPGWCDPAFGGFFNQVYAAARQFNRYRLFPNQFNHAVGRTSFVHFQAPSPQWPDRHRRCGGTHLTMQNAATAGLYNYTPYQPSQAALDHLYGTVPGNSNDPNSPAFCAAYGNRNFWRMFNDWFGSTRIVHLPGCHEATNTARSCIWHLASPAGRAYFTSSVGLRDQLAGVSNFQFQARAFFGNVIQLPGNIPVFGLDRRPGDGSLITADEREYNTLVAAGWHGRGVDFWADPAHSNTGYPVYRLHNRASGNHVWTIDTNKVIGLQRAGYTVESIPFVSISAVRQETAPPVGRQLTYRFYIPQTNSNFWTNNPHERDSLILAGHRYEGIAWQTFSDPANRPVFRLYGPGRHLYTADSNERSTLLATGHWRDEGVAFFVSHTATPRPVFRLFAPSLGRHLFTADANERDVWLGSGQWRDDGIAWHLPQ